MRDSPIVQQYHCPSCGVQRAIARGFREANHPIKCTCGAITVAQEWHVAQSDEEKNE